MFIKGIDTFVMDQEVFRLVDLGCVCFFHLMLNIIFFELNIE